MTTTPEKETFEQQPEVPPARSEAALNETYNYLQSDDLKVRQDTAQEADQFRRMLDNARTFAFNSHFAQDRGPSSDDLIVGGMNLNGPYRLHDVQFDGNRDSGNPPAGKDRSMSAGSSPFVERSGWVGDATGNNGREIRYPNGERAELGKDPSGKEFNSIKIYEKDGDVASHYVKRGDEWFSQTRDGMRAKLEGRIEVSNNGNISMEIEPNKWRTLKPDGTVQMEQQNKDGSRVGFDADGRPNKIVNPDKSSVEADYHGGDVAKVREFDSAGNLTRTWTKDGDKFKSDPPSGEFRRNFELKENGEYKSDVTLKYPDGKERDIGRDKDGKVNKIVTKSEDGKVTLEKDGNQWMMRMGSMPPIPYPGKVEVSANNDVSFETKPGQWHTEKADGTVLQQKANKDGSRVALGDKGEVRQITRADGSVVEGTYKDGKLNEITEYGANGKKTTWSDKGEHWESSDGKTRKNMQMFNTGLTLWEGKDGVKHGVMGDGRTLRERPGEAKFSFDNKGQIDSIAYPDGETLRFTRFDSGAIKEIQQSKNGQLTRTQTRDSENSSTWAVKGADGKSLGTWTGKYEVTTNGTVRHKDESSKNKDGAWNIANPDGSTYKEVTNPDGSRKLTKPDKSFVEIDSNGLVRKTGINKDNYNTFDYQNGQLASVTEYRKGKEPNTVNVTDRKDLKMTETGDMTYRTADGKGVIEKSNLSKVQIDSDGFMQKVTQHDGSTREFTYKQVGGNKELDKITDTRFNEKGETRTETWQREYQSENGFPTNTFKKEGAREGESSVRKNVNVLQNGDYEYQAGDGKTRLAKAGRDSGENGMSADVDEARDRLMEAVEGHMDAPRKQRLEAFMKQFEKRAQTRIEDQVAAGMDREKVEADWQKKVAGTYDHLSQMTKTDLPNAPYDMKTRVDLVENAMLFAMEPTKNNQGSHGTCWIEGPINLIGWTNNPDKMARLVSQVSTTGTFTTIEGPNNGGGPKTYTIPREQLNLGREERSWNLSRMDGHPRSPVGQICDHTLSYIGGRRDGGTNGGTWESFRQPGNRWYYGSQELMRMATGDTAKLVRIRSNQITNSDISRLTSGDLKEEMLKRGGVVLVGPGHIFTAKMVHVNGERTFVTDNQWGAGNDQKIGVLRDVNSWRVDRTRERFKPEWPTGLPRIDDDSRPSPNRPRNRQYPQYYDEGGQPAPYQPYQPQPYQPQPGWGPPRPFFIRRWRHR